MTAFPSNSDSGYCTGIAGSSFSFEEEDIAALSRPCSASEEPKTNNLMLSSGNYQNFDCAWDLSRSSVFQRRRSASCPATPVTVCAIEAVKLSLQKGLKRSISCKEGPTSSVMNFCEEETSRTVGTQTETNANYCTACHQTLEDEESAVGPSNPATVHQEELILDAISNRRCQSLIPFRTGRRLALMGDEFFAEYIALGRREPAAHHRLVGEANEHLLNALAIGWRFANGAFLGAFIAVPIPEIVHEAFNCLRDFLTR